MNNKIAAITLPMAATMQNTKAKWKENFSTKPSCVPYTITPIRIKIPPIKQQLIPASFGILLSLNLNICSDTIATAMNRDNNPSISSACVAFQALVHHGLSIPSSQLNDVQFVCLSPETQCCHNP